VIDLLGAAAMAAARSPGLGAPPSRHCSTLIVERVTPAGSDSVQSRQAPVASSRNRTPSRSIGVNRHSSSRPEGIGKSVTAYDVIRSPREASGTIVSALWV